MEKVLAICGPTGVGKTEVSLYLAERFKGEIINFDSQQFYRELVIGTAKPLPEERGGLLHHLFEELSIFEEMNAGKFVEKADSIVKEIFQRGNLPIFVGGTGLYLRAFEYGLFKVEVNPEIRKRLKEEAQRDLKRLYEELKERDPEYAKKIHPHDKVRIIRALEVIYSTSKPFSEFHQKNPFFQKKRYTIFKIGLLLPREELYDKINKRVLAMLERGWLKEVEELLKKYGDEIFQRIKAIGYYELYQVIKGELTLDAAISLIQKKTRNYAKRQLTWFRKEKDLEWFSPKDLEGIEMRVNRFLEEGV